MRCSHGGWGGVTLLRRHDGEYSDDSSTSGIRPHPVGGQGTRNGWQRPTHGGRRAGSSRGGANPNPSLANSLSNLRPSEAKPREFHSLLRVGWGLGYLLGCSRHCGSHANAAQTLGDPNVGERVRVCAVLRATRGPRNETPESPFAPQSGWTAQQPLSPRAPPQLVWPACNK